MKVVRTFATSANLGPGFDTLGICFNIYNEYSFEQSGDFLLEGFEDEFIDPNNNLIIQSYLKVFKKLNKEIIYIKLKQLVQNIPTSRGLGSSASCIVAGVLIANDMLDNILTIDEVFQISSSIEGHPDNVAPLIFGGMTCSFKNDIFKTIKFNISDIFNFTVCIPPFKLSTAKARAVLPKDVKMEEAVSNISHSIALIKALEIGNMDLLLDANVDKLHQNYRFPLINNSEYFINFAKENNIACMISGAGPTILLISDKKVNISYDDWKTFEVELNNQGAYIYEK